MSEATQGLKLFNTLTGGVEDFLPLDPAGKQVKMYVCGPTVYDDAHLGHARCYVTWDVLYRFLKFQGYQVKYVRNVTDVDDKILNRAAERGEAPTQLAERNYLSFTQDMQALNVLPPDEEPRATHHIGHMLEGIQVLINKGSAYVTPDGSVYFRVAAKQDYGKLSKKPLDDLKTGARVEVDPDKESPLDFALWKAVPLSDPNGWESPWTGAGANKGWGRPGWHMECSAMNHAVFGEQIDIHAGGADLIFPHHENEIAQSEAWTGCTPFSKYWLHNGFVNVSGEKMSKSLGNFATIKTLLARYDANVIRYFLLTNHYRMPVDFNDEALRAAENWVVKTKRVLNETKAVLALEPAAVYAQVSECLADAVGQAEVESLQSLVQDMQADLNTPKALATLNVTLGLLRSSQEESDTLATRFRSILTMLNLLGFELSLFFERDGVSSTLPLDDIQTTYQTLTGTALAEGQSPQEGLSELVRLRKAAKASKNWSQADAIRAQLSALGLQLLDNKDGTTSVEKDGLEVIRV